jgi:D-alanyl-D-alanine carboxypeptidase
MDLPKKTHLNVICLILAAVFLSLITIFLLKTEVAKSPIAKQEVIKNASTAEIKVPSFDKSKYSTTDPSSLWFIANKQHSFNPIDYKPTDLITSYGATIRAIAESDFNAMMIAAGSQGAQPTVVSSFRSYSYQVGLYNQYVAESGQSIADAFSAKPGYSEHQTGLAIDFGSHNDIANCQLSSCYGQTVEGTWLAAHAYEYGFILRYPDGKQSITGYESEPWHYRYVGRELAAEMHMKSISTLEEFFNVSGGEIY